MAAGYLPKPGTEYGPCTQTCNHRDCLHTREDSFRLCPICGNQIGYDTAYYDTSHEAVAKGRIMSGQRELTHARCAEKQV